MIAPQYGPGLYAGLSVTFLVLFVLNVFTHGTALGLVATGGLAVLMGYAAYRSRAARRRDAAVRSEQVPD